MTIKLPLEMAFNSSGVSRTRQSFPGSGWVRLTPTHGAGENGAAAKSFEQNLGGLDVRGKAAEDCILAVVLNDFAAFSIPFCEKE